MTNHTPGPWKFDAVMPGEPDNLCGTRCVSAEYDAEDQAIAYVHPSTTGEGSCWLEAEERDANARLIAAAPDLLEACKLAHRELDTGPGLEACGNAIAKADGTP